MILLCNAISSIARSGHANDNLKENRVTQAASGAVRRDMWTSTFAFLYASAAAAIGLGSLWRFPYVAGVNGGGLFVLLYIAFVVLLCIPLMVAEMSIGRRGSASAVRNVESLVTHERAAAGWKAIGWLSVFIPFMGLSYYAVVAGWTVDYARLAIVYGFESFTAERSLATFDQLMQSPLRAALVHAFFIVCAVSVAARGVQKGIEWISRIKMSALLIILIGLVIYNGSQLDLGRSLRFLFVPDFAALNSAAVLAALGQALFSTAIGVGVMMTYSAYLPAGASLARSSTIICGSVVFVAMLSGLAIFPAVFAYGLKPTEGPNLIFVTLPVAFGQMPAGRIVSVLFFGLVALSAFTTSVGMLEPVIAWVMEKTGLNRARAAMLTGTGIWAVGLPSLLSFNVLKDLHPLDALTPFAGKTIFDLLDFGIANFLLPINALLIALFVGWAVRNETTAREVGLSDGRFGAWHFAVKLLAPAAIVVLLISLWA
jgi:NSS family neurotransmitter:Na+ symporter